MKSNHEVTNNLPYKALGKALVTGGSFILLVESVVGSVALDIALLIILADIAKKNHSDFYTGYFLGSFFSRESSLTFESAEYLILFSFIQSILAGITLSIYFASMQILAGIFLAWAVSFALIVIGDFLQKYQPKNQTTTEAAKESSPIYLPTPSAPPMAPGGPGL